MSDNDNSVQSILRKVELSNDPDLPTSLRNMYQRDLKKEISKVEQFLKLNEETKVDSELALYFKSICEKLDQHSNGEQE